MSTGRGRGRGQSWTEQPLPQAGRGRGRGQQRTEQPMPQAGRGGGRGSGGRGPAPPPASFDSSHFPSLPVASSSTISLAADVEKKLNLASTSRTVQSASQQPMPQGGRGSGRGSGGRGPAPPPASFYPSHFPSLPVASSSTISLAADVEKKLNLDSTSRTVQSASQQPRIRQELSPPVVTPSPPVETPSPLPISSMAVVPPDRPGFGTVGLKIAVRTNHFAVTLSDSDIHQYDVSITPEVASKKVCRDIMNVLIDCYMESHLNKRLPAYDGRKSIYTAGQLPFVSKEFVVKLHDKDDPTRKPREFKVAIKFAAKVDLYHLQQFLQRRQRDLPQETLQALDIVLRSTPSVNYTVVGRSFFSPNLGPMGKLGDGVEYWLGFYQSLRPTQMGLSLNIDMSARPFFDPILVTEFIQIYLNIRDIHRPLSEQDRIKIKKVLRGVNVQLIHLDKIVRKKITSLSQEAISKLMFTVDDSTGKRTSVVDYYKEKYNVILKYPFLPAIQSGSDSKPVYLPMELCKIVEGQRYTKKLNEKQVTNLLRATCQRPKLREQSIRQMVLGNNYNNDDFFTEFGMSMQPEPTIVEARVLPPPRLKYNSSEETPRVGQWNMMNKRLFVGATINFWTCVNFSRLRQEQVDHFCRELVQTCKSKGLNFNEVPLIPNHSASPKDVGKALVNIHSRCKEQLLKLKENGKHLQLLIVILPDYMDLYGTIKRICETELGIISQCCQPKNVVKSPRQYLDNVTLKINVKAGGCNTVLARALPIVCDTPTIIFGADVTHPPPGEDSSPSIAAVVASMDWPDVTKYLGLVSAQGHRDEIISDLYKEVEDPKRGRITTGMIREHLIAFKNSTGHCPRRIIFFRDGVSEGQFSQVLLYEVDAIRKACMSLAANYQPRITFVVVQKRHHTRLFPIADDKRSPTDRSGNILPGTVVDTKICHPREFDFYLCSHAGIQGTSRPTHYHVLYDENELSADALQELTNNLCYTYVRCTRSVSIVSPAYYAHLAAWRARCYLEGNAVDMESNSGIGRGAGNTREGVAAVRPLPRVLDNVKAFMFYC